MSLSLAIGALVFAHASSRWSSAYLMAFVDYARPEAANKVVAESVDGRVLLQATVCLLAMLIIPALVISPWIYTALAVVWLATIACAAYYRSAFTGITGDCLGAANVVVELVCLILVVATVQT